MKKIANAIVLLFSLMFLVSCSSQPEETTWTTTYQTQSVAYESAEQTTAQIQTTLYTTTQTTVVTTERTTVVTTDAVQTTSLPPATVTSSATSEAYVQNENVCIITLDCRTIKDNISSLKKGKEFFVPSDGYILNSVQIEFEDGETVFDVLKRACKENVCTDNCEYCQQSGIQLEYSYTPAFKSYYIEGIHQLYEKNCGTMSGWMYSVNGVFPDYSASGYEVKNGDVIVFSYTCDGGSDVGNRF